MRVKTAARQLSHTVATAIHSYSVSNIVLTDCFHLNQYKQQNLQIIDDLFDSLNGSINPDDSKRYVCRCCLQDDSPHFELYSRLLLKMTKKDVTNQYFVKNWMITIRSVMYLWHQLKVLGFKFLNMRSLKIKIQWKTYFVKFVNMELQISIPPVINL
ncbi:hypothetical protein P5V15_010073 [Pogonomyrmex californicus]